MEKARIKFWVDFIMLIDFLILALSGFILKFFLPHGGFGRFPESIFLFERSVWLRIHDFTSIFILILIFIHLILNWRWIKSMFKFKNESN